MKLSRMSVIAGGLALAAQSASTLADDYLYKGDCARARAVQVERTVDTLFTYTYYTGVQIADRANDACRRDSVTVFNLTLVSRNRDSVVYSFRRQDYLVQPTTGTCQDGQATGQLPTGSVTFTTQTQQSGDICELYMWSNWQLDNAAGTSSSYFYSRVTPVPPGFVLSQPAPRDGQYWSPISFGSVR